MHKYTDWLAKIFNFSVDHSEEPEYWWNAWTVPLYKGKEDKGKCLNQKGKDTQMSTVPDGK